MSPFSYAYVAIHDRNLNTSLGLETPAIVPIVDAVFAVKLPRPETYPFIVTTFPNCLISRADTAFGWAVVFIRNEPVLFAILPLSIPILLFSANYAAYIE